jgi:phytoene synthase
MQARQQAAMAALHGLLQEADRLADAPGEPERKDARIAAFDGFEAYVRDQFRRPAGSAPEFIALTDAGVRWDTLEPAFAAMRRDLEEPARLGTVQELDAYCDAVAGAPGRAILQIAGCPPALIDPLARELGRAVQKTNILRDLEADARDGRRYLPEPLASPTDIARSCRTGTCLTDLPAVAAVAAQAERHYADALATVEAGPATVRVLVGNVAIAYRAILAALASRSYATGSIGRMTKARIAARIVARSLLARVLARG